LLSNARGWEYRRTSHTADVRRLPHPREARIGQGDADTWADSGDRLMPDAPKEATRHLKITVVLLHRHIAALDHLAVSIRLRTGVALSRASIIDPFIAASAQRPDTLVEQMLQERVPASKDRTHKSRR
jgi:hypothetical protein